jgi:Spy/CpxP family protein refolding chaperone
VTRFAPRVSEETEMKKAWPVLVVAVVAVGLSVLPARAQHRVMDREMGRDPGMFYVLFRGANLTPDQEAKVKTILAAHRAKTRELMKQSRAAREEMTDKLFGPGTVTAKDLQPMRQRIAQLWEELSQDRLSAALEIRAVLTPEQLAKAAKLKDRFRELHAEMQALFEGKAKR